MIICNLWCELTSHHTVMKKFRLPMVRREITEILNILAQGIMLQISTNTTEINSKGK